MPAAPWYFATRDRIGPLYAKANTPCILSLEAGARGVIISQLCPECVDEGKLPLWRSGISWLELAAITWSADIARIWAGRSDSTSILTRTSLLSPLAPIMDRSRVLRLTLGISRSVQGQTVGHASLVPDGGERITVQLHGTKSLPFGLLFELFRIAMSSLK
jgi:hypothetical protein